MSRRRIPARAGRKRAGKAVGAEPRRLLATLREQMAVSRAQTCKVEQRTRARRYLVDLGDSGGLDAGACRCSWAAPAAAKPDWRHDNVSALNPSNPFIHLRIHTYAVEIGHERCST